MEFGGSDNFGQLLHVDWLDVDNVWAELLKKRGYAGTMEVSIQVFLGGLCRNNQGPLTKALVADIEVPQVDAQVVGGDVRLGIRVDRNRVDVVGVSVGIDLSGHSGHNRVVVCELWKL